MRRRKYQNLYQRPLTVPNIINPFIVRCAFLFGNILQVDLGARTASYRHSEQIIDIIFLFAIRGSLEILNFV